MMKRCFWGLLFSSLVTPLWALDVEFVRDNQVHLVTAQAIGPGYYQFNPKGAPAIHLATLDWAPYVGEGICGQGWVQQVVVGAFLRENYQVNVRFYPWKRAVKTVESGDADVLFPEYYIEETARSEVFSAVPRRELLALSAPFAGGPLALWKRRDDAFQFTGDLQPLKGLAIGVVTGYVNTAEFDRLAAEGHFAADGSTDDWTNLRKLERGRVSLIVGGPDVLQFTVRSQLPAEQATTFLNQIQMVEPVLEEKPLYLAFSRRRENYQRHVNAFNRALQQLVAENQFNAVRVKYLASAHLDQGCERVAQQP